MKNVLKIRNYLIIAVMVGLIVYGVLFVLRGRSDRTDEAALERDVARNAKYSQLVGGLPRSAASNNQTRVCPAGVAQFAGSDEKCDICHRLQLVGGLPRSAASNNQTRVCPAGAAQFAGGDEKCDICHQLAKSLQNLSDETHHYSNIAGRAPTSQSVEPFPDPQPPGYTAMLPEQNAQTPPIIWGAKPPHGERGRCTDCHKVMPPAETAQAPPIMWGARAPHGKRGRCTDCHKVI